MPTIKDVAEQAGVSITTVSHVINKTRYVSEELRKRVETAIEELDYHPDPLGRGLRKGMSYSIAVLLPDPSNPFFQSVSRGIEEQVDRHHYSISFCNTSEAPDKEKFYIELLQQRKTDGFIIAPTVQGIKNLQSLIEKDIPLIIIDRQNESLQVDQIFSDNVTGGYKATEHLINLGHKKIGLLLGIRELRTIEDRLKGYQKALQDHGIEVKEDLIAEGYSQIEEGYTATEYLVTNQRVTAIFSTNNMMTLGALRYLKEEGIKCPAKISLIGFDDSEWATAFTPSLTVVAQRAYEMGYYAGESLFERIGGERSEARSIELETKLIIRESTARCSETLRNRR